MKVCMLTTGFPRFKGDLFGHFIMALARELKSQGVEVVVVAPHAPGVPRREELEGIAVRRFGYLWPSSWQRLAYGGGIPTNLRKSWLARAQVPLFLAGFWWAARRACQGCQVVHCHWTISGLIARLATWGQPRPLVLSVRGSDIHLMGTGVLGQLNRRVYRWMDRVIAVSEDIAGKLERAGVDRGKIQVVYNGVDQRFQPGDQAAARGQLGLPLSRFIVLFVGLLVPVKGLDVLLEALALIRAPHLLGVLVGEGPLKAELKLKAQRLGLGEQVVFAGGQPTAQIPAWLQAADVLVLPSRSEGRPNVVLEAQACGVPVVATRVGGTPELVQDGENGVLVESGDARDLARGLRAVMADEGYRRALAQRALARFQASGLTWEASARQVRDLYQQVLASGRR